MHLISPISQNEVINSSFDQKVKQLIRSQDVRFIRSTTCDDAGVITLFNNTGLSILFILICLILFLLLLGIIKGILGLYCCPPVGMCGLGALIDLPRPLETYQEREFSHFPVKYDIIGWPVHPQTGKRTVRAISLRTEFCLNVIFFLTYPLIMLITLLSLCCYSHIYDTDDTGREFQDTRTIMLTDCPSVMLNKKTNVMVANCSCNNKKAPLYADDSAEEADTKYVLEQMRKSEESLKSQRA